MLPVFGQGKPRLAEYEFAHGVYPNYSVEITEICTDGGSCTCRPLDRSVSDARAFSFGSRPTTEKVEFYN